MDCEDWPHTTQDDNPITSKHNIILDVFSMRLYKSYDDVKENAIPGSLLESLGDANPPNVHYFRSLDELPPYASNPRLLGEHIQFFREGAARKILIGLAEGKTFFEKTALDLKGITVQDYFPPSLRPKLFTIPDPNGSLSQLAPTNPPSWLDLDSDNLFLPLMYSCLLKSHYDNYIV